MNVFQGLLDFVDAIFNIVLSLLDYLITSVESILTLVMNIPTLIAEILESTGGVFTMMFALFSNIPEKLWIYIYLLFICQLIYFVFWRKEE